MILFCAAFAGGFYHPIDVAGASATYQTNAEGSADKASAMQRKAVSIAAALVDFEEANDLLGFPASKRQATLKKQFNREFGVLQAFIDDQVGGFDAAYTASLERALAAHPGAVRCQRDLQVGRALPGMRVRTEPNPECASEDLNSLLAASMDNDPELEAQIAVLHQRTWPDFTLVEQPIPIDAVQWISVPRFFQAHFGRELRAIRSQDEEQRSQFYVAIEQGATTAELNKMRADAAAVDRRTAMARNLAAAGVLARAEQVFTKKAPGAGWCVQPAVFGGCTGTDATPKLEALLLADKKLQKALP